MTSHLVVQRKSDVAMERIATLDTLERARIALANYRMLMHLHAPARGLVSEDYPFGMDVENELRDLLGEPRIDGESAIGEGLTSTWPSSTRSERSTREGETK